MSKNIIALILSLLLCLFLVACEQGASNQSPTTSANLGTLKVSLTDTPADFDAVNITFSEVSANIDGEWMILSEELRTINLLEFSNGRTTEIGSADVPVGQYTQIRLKIAEAEVIVDGVSHPVTVPSGAQTGLKLITEFAIVEGSTVELIVDFDANRSVVTTGPPNEPKSYKLKPTLRVISRAITGSISGIVINPQNLPVAMAIAGSDTVTTTSVADTTGEFMLGFLPEGFYTVSVKDTLNQFFESNDVEVIAGANNDVGMVTLQ